ncbi:ATP-binding protein, partial [Actinospica durhamensis]
MAVMQVLPEQPAQLEQFEKLEQLEQLENEAGDAHPLLGREFERAQVERALDALSQGTACLVEISGDPGIGKTRMLAQIGYRAQRRGFPLLAGRTAVPACERPAGATLGGFGALGALGEAIDDHLRGVAPRCLADLNPEHRERLAALFPSFPSPTSMRSFPSLHAFPAFPSQASAFGNAPERERSAHGLFLSVRALLEALASAGPIVITLDDVHWADEDTTTVLALLL